MIRILHYREKCIGCNACVEVAPERWRISRNDGKSTLIGSTTKKGIQMVVIHKDELEVNTTAANNCPVKIIRLEPVGKK